VPEACAGEGPKGEIEPFSLPGCKRLPEGRVDEVQVIRVPEGLVPVEAGHLACAVGEEEQPDPQVVSGPHDQDPPAADFLESDPTVPEVVPELLADVPYARLDIFSLEDRSGGRGQFAPCKAPLLPPVV
jgi:hypothetical protein